ncbi:ABC transporter permease [Natronosalvus caseinilyticus]|uniref:ABC transporter permease n=1 Tax=Natronosalvus caseinilyticus TaxID=2953747 RepID=UPI003CCD0C80
MTDGNRERRTRREAVISTPERRSIVADRVRPGLARGGPPLVTFAFVLALWQGVTVVYDVPTVILPSPIDVGAALAEGYPTLLADAAVTAATAALGLGAGAAVGLVFAFAMIHSRSAARTILPYVVALRIAPLIAVAPLLFLWFGRGIPARALLVATLTLFPMTIATLDGLRSTPSAFLDLAASVGASSLETFLRVRVPVAAPSVFAGLKIAATLAVVGAVVAEFVTLRSGIGYRVFYSAARLETATSYAALAVLSLVGVGFYLLPALLERRVWTT